MNWLSRPGGSIHHQGETIGYELVHRPRVTRRVHLELAQDGGLLVVAPRGMSRRAVQRSLQQRADRVVRFVAVARSRRQDLPDLQYVDGEQHLYLGEAFTLNISSSGKKRSTVSLNGRSIAVQSGNTEADRVRELLRHWYRTQARQDFAGRLELICDRAPWTAGYVPPLQLRRMKRSWGNCSAAGLIKLNTHLVKAPPELVDYVIAHEVCHLSEHNHGKAFYALQEQLYPDWRAARSSLKARGHIYLHE